MIMSKVNAFLCVAIVACLVSVAVLMAKQERSAARDATSVQLSAELPIAAASAVAPVVHENISDAGPVTAQNDWVPLTTTDWPQLLGKWIGAERGDAVSTQDKLVIGGARVEIFQAKPKSKTPYNVQFFVPRKGDDVERSMGGCGFYPSGEAHCRGYGLPEEKKARVTLATFERRGDRLRFSVSGVLMPIDLVREPLK